MFASLAVPPDLAGVLDPGLPAAPEGVRAIPAERWHLTLAFFGELDDAALDCVARRMRRRLPRTGAIALQVAGGGGFSGGVGYLAVAGVAATDEEAMRALALQCHRAGRGCDAPGTSGRYRFRAHITVARSRRHGRLPPHLLDALAIVRSPVWSVDEVLLVSSHLGPQPSYDVLRRFPLVE